MSYQATLAAQLSAQLGVRVDVGKVMKAIEKSKVNQDVPIFDIPATEDLDRLVEISAAIRELEAERAKLTASLDKLVFPIYQQRCEEEKRFIPSCHFIGSKAVYCAQRHAVAVKDDFPSAFVAPPPEPKKPKRYAKSEVFDAIYRDPDLRKAAESLRPITFFKERQV